MRSIPLGILATLLLALLVSPLLGTVVGSPRPPSQTVPALTARPIALSTPDIGQTATATRTIGFVLTHYQNGSALFDGGSTAALIPSNISDTPRTSSVSYTAIVSPSMTGGNTAMINVTQNPKTLANATVGIPFSISPAVSSTEIRVTVPAAFTSMGAVVGMGTYPVYVNVTLQVTYYIATPPVWTLKSGIEENLSYSLVVPSLYVLSSVTIFVPFPATVPANTSTLNVTANGRNWSSYQLVVGGIYVYLPSVTATEPIAVRFNVSAIQYGVIPQIPLRPVYQLPSGLWQGNASWVNIRQLPYSGIFLITTNLSYAISPVGLNISTNYGKFLPNGSFVLAGNTIEILPGAVRAVPGSVVVFRAIFALVGAPVSLSIFDSTPLVGGSSITLGDLLLGIAVFLFLYVIYEYLTQSRASTRFSIRNAESPFWIGVYLFAIDLMIFLVLLR